MEKMIEMFERAVICWRVVVTTPKWRQFLNLQIDIDQLQEPEKSKIIEELPVILADQRMDEYMKHPYKLKMFEKALAKTIKEKGINHV